ncbi:arsenical-resistance protein ACR3 [Wolfiporia cocos MD-104 SS10]|uniref:Arsenical-resistance protein ACR3 n=1 Tax=Wolfiporia cocos (strain MD-104) TaxID=742152 RepID=A0A2H3JPJ0_WOLCO|nr:arsenical-resistance protein ACR3 [Wolfiporia cocos MD-104 SS10]
MIIGVIIGEFAPGVQPAFDTARFASVSAPIAVGLIVMMWPILTKVQYEALPRILLTRTMLTHVLLSMALNWVVAPFVMLAFAWATLPDLPTYRTGVIMVGLARCIAMVMVWNQLAKGDTNYCAVLVVLNSVLQIALYSPYAVWFVNIMGGAGSTIHISYGNVAISVLIYLGIPLGAGLLTRAFLLYFTSHHFLTTRFLPIISPLAPLGLLYTVIVLFAYQGHHILHNIGPVFRVMVPLVLYFTVMWAGAFALVWWLGRRARVNERGQAGIERWGYEMAVVQSFTAGSNNFELAIAVSIAVYGVGSDQALAATIGPLVEVPVLLTLTWVALYLGRALTWNREETGEQKDVENRGITETSPDPEKTGKDGQDL